MKANIKFKLLKALRSGEYTQARGYMRNSKGDRFCVLGVLADVAGVPGRDGLSGFEFPNGNGNNAIPPNEFLDEVGLTYTAAEGLASKNDGSWSFESLADYIEANL